MKFAVNLWCIMFMWCFVWAFSLYFLLIDLLIYILHVMQWTHLKSWDNTLCQILLSSLECLTCNQNAFLWSAFSRIRNIILIASSFNSPSLNSTVSWSGKKNMGNKIIVCCNLKLEGSWALVRLFTMNVNFEMVKWWEWNV